MRLRQPVPLRVCQHCRVEYRSARAASKYCSQACSGVAVNAPRHAPPKPCPVCSAPVVRKFKHARTVCSRRCGGVLNAQRDRKHAHICVDCHEPFIGSSRQLFCSRLCRSRQKDRIRHRPDAERFAPREIFERDDWTCHLCGDACDQTARVPSSLAATLDHVIPVSLGGPHTRANVRCAHFSCNTRRGTRHVAAYLAVSA